MRQNLCFKLLTIICLCLALVGLIITISPNIYANYVGILMWGSPGAAKGQFLYPNDNALNSTGDVYVADTYNHRIQVFRIGLDICPDGKKPIAPGVCFIKKWGSNGYGKGQFAVPQGVTVDSKDNVFVADTGNQRIQVFRFGHLCPSTPVVPGVCFIKMWGSHGTGKGEFIFPSGTAVDSKGNIFVVDYGNHRIQTFRLQNACPTGGPSGSTQIGLGVCYINEWHQTGGGSQFQDHMLLLSIPRMMFMWQMRIFKSFTSGYNVQPVP